MKLKRIVNEDGTVVDEVLVSEADDIEGVTLRLTEAEERGLAPGYAPLTDAEKRVRVSQLQSSIERPERENWREYLRWGQEAIYDLRAQTVGSGAGGGFLAPQEFSTQIFTMLKKIDALFDPAAISIIETTRGTAESVPLLDDTSSAAGIVAENGSRNVADVAFDQLALPAASTWSTPIGKWPMELVQDSAFDVETLLGKTFAAQLARGIGPTLVATLAAGATSGISAGASAIAVDNIYDLFGSIDPAYLSNPKCAWAMRLSTLVYLSKLKGSDGQAVFPIRRNPNGDFELLTLPVRICPSVAAIGTGAKSVFLGDLSYLVMRRVRNSLSVRRFDEVYASIAQVGFCSFLRVSIGFAKPSASDSPVKFLQHS